MAIYLENRTFKYRAYPTKRQAESLELHLSEAARLYNAALQERRDAYRMCRETVSFYSQDKQLKDIRAAGDLAIPNAHVARDVLRRVDRAFQGFFRRVKSGKPPGYPRFRAARRYDSITYDNGYRLDGDRVRLQGVGSVKLRLHRPVAGEIKTVTVQRSCGRWYVCFSVVVDAQPLPRSNRAVGVDVGLSSFAVLSTGESVDNPQHYRAAARGLRVAQRRVARRKKGSARRRKAVALLQWHHARIRHQRADFQHKLSRRLVNEHGLIAVEDLNVTGLARTRLAKSIHDAAWSSFIGKLAYKAEEAGRELVRVDPRGTSQTCVCGARVPKRLSDREHVCQACGLVADRDHVSAQVILQQGRAAPSDANRGASERVRCLRSHHGWCVT